jgi:hypothetical protein
MEPQLSVGLEPAEVGETGCVIEENAKRQLTPALVVREVVVLRIVWQRLRKKSAIERSRSSLFLSTSCITMQAKVAFVREVAYITVSGVSGTTRPLRIRATVRPLNCRRACVYGSVDGAGRQSASIKSSYRLCRGNGWKCPASTQYRDGCRGITHRSEVRKVLTGSSTASSALVASG